MSRTWDLARLGTVQVLRRPLVSLLTTLGVTVGIAAIVGVVTLTQQVELALTDQIDRLGANMLLILPFDPVRAESSETLQIDTETLQALPGVENIGLIYQYRDGLPLTQENGPNGFPLVIGLSESTFTEADRFFVDFELSEGERPALLEQTAGLNMSEALLSAGAAESFQLDVDDRFEISDRVFSVSGILATTNDRSLNNAIFINIETLWVLTDEVGVVSNAWVHASDSEAVELLELELNALLAQSRQPYSIQSSERLQVGVRSILEILRTAMLGIGLIALIVGALGVANTLFMAVVEQRRVIGTYITLGATERQVLWIYLVQAALFGLAGGIMGVILGFGLAASFAILFAPSIGSISTPFDFSVAAAAVIFSVVFAVIAGLIPSLRAASIQPADALRYE